VIRRFCFKDLSVKGFGRFCSSAAGVVLAQSGAAEKAVSSQDEGISPSSGRKQL
jgi:hypothetical protein